MFTYIGGLVEGLLSGAVVNHLYGHRELDSLPLRNPNALQGGKQRRLRDTDRPRKTKQRNCKLDQRYLIDRPKLSVSQQLHRPELRGLQDPGVDLGPLLPGFQRLKALKADVVGVRTKEG